MNLPSGEYAPARTGLVELVLTSGYGCAPTTPASQTLRGGSFAPTASALLVGEKATELTGPLYLSAGTSSFLPVSTSQSRTVLPPPVARVLLSGEKATALTLLSCPSSG